MYIFYSLHKKINKKVTQFKLANKDLLFVFFIFLYLKKKLEFYKLYFKMKCILV